MDPRRWDLAQLLAAYEVTLKQGAKDDAAHRRLRSQLYAEPSEVKKERIQKPVEGQPQARYAMSLEGAEALLAGIAARDSKFGAA